MDWSMAETRHFFSWLVDGLASCVQRQVSLHGQTDWRRQHDAFPWYDWPDQQQRHDASSLGCSTVWLVTQTDWRRQHDAFSWYDWRWQHDATSSGRKWTDQCQRHNSSSLGWSTVWLVTCNSKSACVGGLIDSGDTTLFLGMIDQINGRDTTLLLLAGQRFG